MRIRRVALGMIATGMVLAWAACTDDAVTTPAGTDASVADLDTGAPPADEDAGEVILDGGGNIDLDGGLFEGDDAGPGDAGDGGVKACNALKNLGAVVTATCRVIRPRAIGGTLVAGSYQLVGVAVLGNLQFCGVTADSGTFKPTAHQSALDVTVNGLSAIAERVETVSLGAVGRTSRRTYTLTPSVSDAGGSVSPLGVKTSCPIGVADTTWAYSTVLLAQDGKQHLYLTLPYGTTSAIYDYAKN